MKYQDLTLDSPFTASSLSGLYSLELEADRERDNKLCLLEPVLPKLLLASRLPVLSLATLAEVGVLMVFLGAGVILLVLGKEERCLVNELTTLTVRSSILTGDVGILGAVDGLRGVEREFNFD
jgi:hypothetical protein